MNPSKRVLVVDDEKELVDALQLELEENNYAVLKAYDGLEGLERARKESPDLIVLDLMLPKMDGYKVCALLKKDDRYAKIPVILFTGKAQEEDRGVSKHVGADAYITKPFGVQQLLDKIRQLISSEGHFI